MSARMRVKDSAWDVALYLSRHYPYFCSVAELIRGCNQTDVRKRVSELLRAGYEIEKERDGKYIKYRWTA